MPDTKPLTGIKILDLTRLLPGPMCTMHLADMGADVIKIEQPGIGDYARYVPPLKKTNSAFFLSVNRNKRSVTLDLAKPEGQKIFLKLSETADVIVESFRPGVVSKLGIGYDAIKQINSRIIYCSITGYGQTGPYRNKAGHDLNYSAYTGIINHKSSIKNQKPVVSAVTEWSRGEAEPSKIYPVMPNFPATDIIGGSLNSAMAILAALVYQKTSGKGQYLDIAIMDGILAHNTPGLANDSIPDADLLTGALPCYNIYETSDYRFMALAALEFKFWEIFCKAVNRDDLITSHIVVGMEAKEVYEKVAAIFKKNTLAYWIEYFKDIDCCISPVLSFDESLNNEQVIAREMIINNEHPSEGNVTQFSLPIKSSEFEFTVQLPAPLLGEHTQDVLSSAGYTVKEIEDFRVKKII